MTELRSQKSNLLDSKQPDAVGLPTSDVGAALEFVVGLGYCFFGRAHQGGEVVPVGEIGGFDGWQDANLGLARIAEFGSGGRYAIGAFNDDREDGKSGVDGDAKRPLLEGKQLMGVTPCPFRKHDQGIAAFCRELDAIVDRLPARASCLTINFDDADPAHGRCHERDLEQFLFCKEPPVDRQNSKEQRNVECRKVIGNHDIASMGIDMLDAFDGELNWRYVQKGPCPMLHDPLKDRRGRSKDAVHDDECGVDQREHEEQRNQDERAGSCNQRLRHVGSVDEMRKATT